MKTLFSILLLAIGCAIAAPSLWHEHTLTLIPAILAGFCIGFACFLADSADFVAFMTELRASATCWFKRGAP